MKNLSKLILENLKIQKITEDSGDKITLFLLLDGKKIGYQIIKVEFVNYYFEDSPENILELFDNESVYVFEMLEILPEYRGNGYANKLFKEALKIAKNNASKLNISEIYLNACPIKDYNYGYLNLNQLVHFYKKFGFKEILHQGGNVQMLLKI